MNNIRNQIIALAASTLLVTATMADTFDFKDPKGVNNVAFSMDAPLEYIAGTANGISGTVDFDPAHPEKTSGTIVLDTATLMVANSMMRDHMLGGNWMDVANHPTITFKAHHLKDVSGADGKFKGTAVGEFTVKGITHEVEFPVSLTYLPGKLADRNRGMEGDILVIRSDFTILRSNYGINAGQNEDKVADEVELKLSIAGFYAK
jgi:polyisoprenoid-binding protein YceI